MSSSEDLDDPLYDAVFNTPEGKAALTGFAVAAAVMIPSMVIESNIDLAPEYVAQSKDISAMQLDVTDLQFAPDALKKEGDPELAASVQAKIDSLNLKISTAQANLPPHLAHDVVQDSLLIAPLLAGTFAGVALYRRLKRNQQ